VPRRGYRFIAPVQAVPSFDDPVSDRQGAGAGHVRSDTAEPARSTATPVLAPAARTTRWPALLLLALVGVAVGWSGWQAWHPSRPIVAVAVFDNETGRAGLDALATTAADVMVARLTALGTQTLGVIGSTPRLRQPRAERDPRAVREETGAGYLVFGQLQPDEAGVRLIVHLIRLDDQTHLWVTRVPRSTAALDGIQDAVADRLVDAVRAHVIDRNPRAPRFTP
jgi:TolB-like protein